MAGDEKKKKTAKAAGSKPAAPKSPKRSAPQHKAASPRPEQPKPAAPRPEPPKVDWPVFTEKMEQALLALRAEIVDTLIAGNNDFKEIVEGMDPKDFADIASDDIDRKMIEVLGSQELKRLKQIESALTRISQGKYGHCIKCEKRIPPDRLEAIPYALMCIECKQEEERRNR